MNSPLRSADSVRFGAFEIDRSTGRLLKSGIQLKLPPQPFRLLLLLIDNHGKVVRRDQIQRHLWDGATFVDFERGINYSVNQIRAVLGDDPDHPRYVETLPRIGYRFIAEVQDDGSSELPASARLFAMPPNAPVRAVPHATDESAQRPTTTSNSIRLSNPRWILLVSVLVAAFATAGITVWRSRSLTRHSAGFSYDNLQVVKLPDTGNAGAVAISRDGRYVAYVRNSGDMHTLFLRQTSGGADVQVLAPDRGNYVAITFSPDGSSLYFVRSDPKDISFRYLFQVPALGGVPRKLISDVDSGVAFSPDGRHIAFQRWLAFKNEAEVRIANTDGSGERLLSRIENVITESPGEPSPVWSPDGRTIVLSKNLLGPKSRGVVFAVSTENGSLKELYSTTNPLGRAVWLSSGAGLLVPQYDPARHRSQLWIVSLSGGSARRFTHDILDYSGYLDYATDGQSVVTTVGTVESHLWTSPATQSLQPQQITSGERPFFAAKVLRDGRILSTDAYGSIWTMNSDGTQAAILGNVQDVGSFTLCQDYIVTVSYRDSSATLVRMDLNGSHAAPLVSGNLLGPSCAPEGDSVYYTNFDQPQKIWRVPLGGGDPVEVAPIQGDCITGDLSVSPDGKLLAYQFSSWSASPASRHVAVVHANGGPPPAIFEAPGELWMVGPYWTPDGRSIQYLRVENEVSNIWEQSLTGGPAKQLTHFSSGHILDFAWSSDRSRLYFTRDTQHSDVVLFTNLH
jgi:Tol biopolymer transport system component/DNA-binding winged helix-turn-helix (wHTH) protein